MEKIGLKQLKVGMVVMGGYRQRLPRAVLSILTNADHTKVTLSPAREIGETTVVENYYSHALERDLGETKFFVEKAW